MVLDTRNQNFLPLLSGTSYKQYFHFKERIIVEYLNHYKMMPEKKGREGGREGERDKESKRKRHSRSINLPDVPEYKGWGMNGIHTDVLENKLYLVQASNETAGCNFCLLSVTRQNLLYLKLKSS